MSWGSAFWDDVECERIGRADGLSIRQPWIGGGEAKVGSKRVGHYRLAVDHSQGQELGLGVQLWSFIGQ